jgi:hypothetical protein
MLKNYLFFFKRHFDFFKNKYLAPGLMFLAVLFLISCQFYNTKSKVLAVPHIQWEHTGWCGAACIQMWAFYDKSYLSQQQIATYIGWYGSDVYGIAEGVTQFTDRLGFASFFHPSNDQQDAALSAQVSAIKNDAPSISITKNGTHSIIIIGGEWTELPGGTPRADFLTFNDPERLDTDRVGAWTWKDNYFTPNPVSNKYEIVLSCPDYIFEGADGHQEFKARGGTYYGDPGDPEIPDEPIE